MFQFPDVIDVMATQQHYSQAELKIRRQPEYEKLKKALKKSEQVSLWKQDCLEIQIYSERIKGSIRQIKEPICFDDCKDVIIDLYDMFLNKEQEACKKCMKKPASSSIKSESFYKDLIPKINEKAFYCSFYAGRVFHAYSKKIQPYSHEILIMDKNQDYLKQIIKNTNQEQVQNHLEKAITQILRNQSKNTRQIIKLPLHCLINAQKIIIPIMFDKCQHLECYEFTNILKLINDEKKKIPFLRKSSFKCFHQDCDNVISLDLRYLIKQNKILFPAELSESISKEYSFALNVSWNYQQNRFVYDKTSIKDQEIFEIIKKQLLKDTLHLKYLLFSSTQLMMKLVKTYTINQNLVHMISIYQIYNIQQDVKNVL